MTGLAITGYPSTWRSPFVAALILMGQGTFTAGVGGRGALFVGPMTASGTATAATVYEIRSEADVITLTGPGSPLHRAVATHLALNKTGKISVLPYAASSGVGAVAASNTITVTVSATNPTGTGTIVLALCDRLIDVSFSTSSTATTIGEEIEAKINAQTILPFTANNSSGTVTNTAKIAGASQNAIYRTRVVSVTSGKGVSVAASAATLGSGADGATTENANLVAALATITASDYYYVGMTSPVSGDITSAAAHVIAKSEPNPGLRCRLFAGSVAALSSIAAIAIARNSERVNVCWQLNSNHCPAQLAAALLAASQREEETDKAASLNMYSPSNWPIQRAALESDWPDAQDIEDAIVDGVTPIASSQNRSWIVKAVSTRSKDSTGAVDDFRAAEPHRVSVMDHFAATLVLQSSQRYSRAKLMDDIYLPDGTVDTAFVPPKGVLLPSVHKSFVAEIIGQFADNGLFQREADWQESLVDRIDPENPRRLQVGVSGRVIDLLDQQSYLLSETTPA